MKCGYEWVSPCLIATIKNSIRTGIRFRLVATIFNTVTIVIIQSFDWNGFAGADAKESIPYHRIVNIIILQPYTPENIMKYLRKNMKMSNWLNQFTHCSVLIFFSRFFIRIACTLWFFFHRLFFRNCTRLTICVQFLFVIALYKITDMQKIQSP